MPVIFTFMFGSFPAGLVIYYAWNNTLTVLQQSLIMKRAGTKIELFDNLRKMFAMPALAGLHRGATHLEAPWRPALQLRFVARY